MAGLHDACNIHVMRVMNCSSSITASAASRVLAVFLAFVGVVHSTPMNLKAALFVFGDSLYDPGNNNYINTNADFRANFWPYGESFFNPPSGRFTDGRTIPDFIAELAGLPLLQAHLKPGVDQNYAYGANFASAGAGALEETNLGYVVTLKEQLGHFKDVKKKLRKNLGDDEAERVASNAVYLLNFGSNEYTNIDLVNEALYLSCTQDQYVGMVVGNITMLIKDIYKIGGRKFGFLTMPAVGSFPGVRVRVPGNYDFEEMNTLAKMHNHKFSISLVELEKLNRFIYAIFDISTAIAKRMTNPLKYGFKEGIKACCGIGPMNGRYSCGGKRKSQRPDYLLCDDPRENFFFDPCHPCQVGYKQLADLFWNGNINVVSPFGLNALFLGSLSEEKEELSIAQEKVVNLIEI